jgi:apolipoprotein N-acyltransferase
LGDSIPKPALSVSIILSLLLSFALLASFPPYGQTWLAWVGLAPLLVSLACLKPRHGFLLAYGCGIIFFSGLYAWVFDAPGYRVYHHAILALIMGLYFGLFGVIVGFVSARAGTAYALLAAPFAWVGVEYLKSNVGFLSLPFPLLGHSQYPNLSLIQFCAYTGAYGASFLLVLVNASLAALILGGLSRKSGGEARGRGLTWGAPLLLSAASLVCVGLAFAHGRLSLSEPGTGKTIRVSVIQGNIERSKKGNPKKHARYIMEKYTELTRKAAQDKPVLIVWPEAATPGFALGSRALKNEIQSLVRESDAYFVIGSAEFPKLVKEAAASAKYGNTALYFKPDGEVVGQYLKIQLIPFAEYVPYKETIPWPSFIIPANKEAFELPGKEHTLFSLDGEKFGVVICSECAFPDVFRMFAKKGANFMLNITNEGWFGATASYQKVAASVFRCVENRVSMARATNTGISCFIDPHGRILGTVETGGKKVFVEGYLTKNIPLSRERTFYTTHGEVFAYLCILVTALLVGLSFIKRRRRS